MTRSNNSSESGKNQQNGSGKGNGKWTNNKKTGKRNNKFNRNNNSTTSSAKFKGNCEELQGYIFDCSDNQQTVKYAVTMRWIAEHVGAAYKQGGDIRMTIKRE